MTNIREIVKGHDVRFNYYRKGELWYDVLSEAGARLYSFPVPISDCGDGQFNREDKAIYFMRYIRKELEARAKEQP